MTDDALYDEAKKLMRELRKSQALEALYKALHPTQEEIELANQDIEIRKAILRAELSFALGRVAPLAPPLHPVDAPPVDSTMHSTMHSIAAPPVHPQSIRARTAPSESNAPPLPKRESPRHARLPDGSYRCSLCGHVAESRNSIKSHYRRKHRE